MFQRVAAVGLGLIGASMAAGLRRTGSYVVGFDAVPASVETALDRGLVDEGAESLAQAVKGADIVVLAVPVLAIVDLLPTVDAHLSDAAVLIDTGSVKTPIVRAMAGLRSAERAVGGHPLAGKEQAGVEAADPDLFRDRAFLLVPSDRTADRTLGCASALAESLGARPAVVDAQRHDCVLARTSHLPQILSTALALSLDPEDMSLAGPGLRDMIRLAGSEPAMWRDILLANRQQVLDASLRCMDRLEELVRVIESADPAGIESLMRQGQASFAQLGSGVPG